MEIAKFQNPVGIFKVEILLANSKQIKPIFRLKLVLQAYRCSNGTFLKIGTIFKKNPFFLHSFKVPLQLSTPL
jgi:hypothetical protein